MSVGRRALGLMACAVLAVYQPAAAEEVPAPVSASGAAVGACCLPAAGCVPAAGCGCCQCPNDYCRKPAPNCPPPWCLWCCNDYLRKPRPLIPPPYCPQCPDDYCRKPDVRVRPNCLPWYRCVPDMLLK